MPFSSHPIPTGLLMLRAEWTYTIKPSPRKLQPQSHFCKAALLHRFNEKLHFCTRGPAKESRQCCSVMTQKDIKVSLQQHPWKRRWRCSALWCIVRGPFAASCKNTHRTNLVSPAELLVDSWLALMWLCCLSLSLSSSTSTALTSKQV